MEFAHLNKEAPPYSESAKQSQLVILGRCERSRLGGRARQSQPLPTLPPSRGRERVGRKDITKQSLPPGDIWETVQKPMEKNRYSQKGMSPGGFTLTEVMIVLGLLAIVSAIGYPLLQRTVINGNLRSAARDLIGDFNHQKQRAMSGDTAAAGSRVHRISLSLGTNSYTLQRCTGTTTPCNDWENLQVKNLSAFGNDIVFDPGSTNPTTFDFHPRGMVTFLDETEGKIALKNNRESTATITTNLAGRTFVDFNMQ